MVRFGIIGAGRMGNAHARQTTVIPGACVGGVYDIDPARAEAMSKEFGAKIFASPDALAADPAIDCVWIASPTYIHQEAFRAAVKARKPVFCEKALCRTPEVAAEMLALGENYDKLMTFGFVRRHMYKSLKVKEMIEAGMLGKLRFANIDLPLGMYKRLPGDWFADFDLCGGVIVDMLAHHIDLCNWYFGKAERVCADGLLMDKSLPLPSDYVSGTVSYQSGVIVNMMCSWWRFGRTNELMEIYGDKGALAMDNSDTLTFYPLDGEPVKIDAAGEAKKIAESGVNNVKTGSGFTNQMAKIVDILSGQNQFDMPTIRDAYASLEVAFAMIEAVRRREVVTL